MFLSPLGERLGEGEATDVCPPSPNLSPLGERQGDCPIRADGYQNKPGG